MKRKDLNSCKYTLIIQDRHLIKRQQIHCVSRLNSKEIYDILAEKNVVIPSSQQYYNDLLRDIALDWKNIYLLQRIVSLRTKVRIFECKLLNNILYLDKRLLFKFGKVGSSLCSFCKTIDKTLIHLSCECHITWDQLRFSFEDEFSYPQQTPKSAIFGLNDLTDNFFLINHLSGLSCCYMLILFFLFLALSYVSLSFVVTLFLSFLCAEFFFSNQLPPTFSHLLGANKRKKRIKNYVQRHNFHIAELKSVWTLLSIKLKTFVFSETVVTQKRSMPHFVPVKHNYHILFIQLIATFWRIRQEKMGFLRNKYKYNDQIIQKTKLLGSYRCKTILVFFEKKNDLKMRVFVIQNSPSKK